MSFLPEMEALIMAGKKCCTTRKDRKGELGDLFVVRNQIYTLVQVIESLNPECFYGAEGCRSADEFIRTMKSIYGESWRDDPLYTHFFAFTEFIVGDCDCCLLDEEPRLCIWPYHECPGNF